jgi:hypothetical protein
LETLCVGNKELNQEYNITTFYLGKFRNLLLLDVRECFDVRILAKNNKFKIIYS